MTRTQRAGGAVLLLLLVAVASWFLVNAGGGGTRAAPAPRPVVPQGSTASRPMMELPVPEASPPLALETPVASTTAPSVEGPPAEVPRFAQLVQALLEVEARNALDFHAAALEVMQPWLQRELSQRPVLVDEARTLLDQNAYSPPSTANRQPVTSGE